MAMAVVGRVPPDGTLLVGAGVEEVGFGVEEVGEGVEVVGDGPELVVLAPPPQPAARAPIVSRADMIKSRDFIFNLRSFEIISQT
jgi:hypothetical protein